MEPGPYLEALPGGGGLANVLADLLRGEAEWTHLGRQGGCGAHLTPHGTQLDCNTEDKVKCMANDFIYIYVYFSHHSSFPDSRLLETRQNMYARKLLINATVVSGCFLNSYSDLSAIPQETTKKTLPLMLGRVREILKMCEALGTNIKLPGFFIFVIFGNVKVALTLVLCVWAIPCSNKTGELASKKMRRSRSGRS